MPNPITEAMRETAREIVDGFFIGGGGDTLEQPHMTKADLVHSIAHALATQAPGEAMARLQAWLDESVHRDAKLFRQHRMPDGAKVWTVRLDDSDRPKRPWMALEESLDDAIDVALKQIKESDRNQPRR